MKSFYYYFLSVHCTDSLIRSSFDFPWEMLHKYANFSFFGVAFPNFVQTISLGPTHSSLSFRHGNECCFPPLRQYTGHLYWNLSFSIYDPPFYRLFLKMEYFSIPLCPLNTYITNWIMNMKWLIQSHSVYKYGNLY